MKAPGLIIEQLDSIRSQLSATAVEIRDAEAAAGDADREYKRAVALAYRRVPGSIEDRKQQAMLECGELLKRRDQTAALLSHTKLLRANLELEQSNLQTQARVVSVAIGGRV